MLAGMSGMAGLSTSQVQPTASNMIQTDDESMRKKMITPVDNNSSNWNGNQTLDKNDLSGLNLDTQVGPDGKAIITDTEK